MTTREWHDRHYEHNTAETHPKSWHPFIEVDPFNPENQLAGDIQIRGGDEYGTLAIKSINGKPAPQLIVVTPKTTYPFFKDGSWILQGVQHLEAYLKLDGTNIYQFGYQDSAGNHFTSFKVRTKPFMSPRFIILLEKALRQYPGIQQKRLLPGECLVYELFGYENPMLIRYAASIELALLFARLPNTDIITLQTNHRIFEGIDCPQAEHRPIVNVSDLKQEYQRRQEELTQQLCPVTDQQFDGQEGGQFNGQEGEMLYATFPDGARTNPGAFTRLIKLKARQIEEIHWASDHIARKELQATCRNIFELTENPTEQDLIQLLAEKWSESQIENSLDTMRHVLQETIKNQEFKESVKQAFQQIQDAANCPQNRQQVMRGLSQHFPRKDMKKVYSALLASRLIQ